MASFFDIQARRRAAAEASASAGTSIKKADPDRPIPWVEKYRPKALSEVAAQEHTIDVLKRTLQSSNLPHMLFYGPPGTGKTSTILALAKELYGPELAKTRVLELNASDERGISIVREKVKNFARVSVSAPSEHAKKTYPCPPYKIIILDEADSMTSDAQSALRRTMETYSRITRFCLICNFVTRIIDPLASRCSKFRFKPLEEGSAIARLGDISAREGVPLESPAVLDALVKVAEGDLRKAITYLQSAARLHAVVPDTKPSKKSKSAEDDVEMTDLDSNSNSNSNNNPPDGTSPPKQKYTPITVRSIEEIAGVIPPETISHLLSLTRPHPSKSTFPPLQSAVANLAADGWSAAQLVAQLYAAVLADDLMTSRQKAAVLALFSEVDKRLADGSDEELQVLDLLVRISGVLAKG